MANTISFNGTDYASVDDMPVEVRTAYDRIMSLAQTQKGGSAGGPKISIKVSTNMKLVHEGKVYNRTDPMPPEVRAKFDQAMAQIDKNHDGVPDMLESYVPGIGGAATPDPLFEPSAPLLPTSLTSSTAAQRPTNNTARSRMVIILVAVIVVVLLGLAVAVYIYHG